MDSPEHKKLAVEAALRAALVGGSLVAALREFRRMSPEELARLTGIPVARFQAEEEKRLAFTDDEFDLIAAALRVPVDLLMD